MTGALLIVFVVTPLAGLVIPITHVHGAYWYLWGVGAVMSAMCVFFFAMWVKEGFRG